MNSHPDIDEAVRLRPNQARNSSGRGGRSPPRRRRPWSLAWQYACLLLGLASGYPAIGLAECDPEFHIVSQNGFGDSNNRYAWSMRAFGPHLYVGTLNRSAGAQIWRFDGNWWELVVAGGLTSGDNQGVRNLEVCHGALYAGVDNPAQGAELWRSADGTTWEATIQGGFGTQTVRNVRGLFCVVFDSQEYLYAGLHNSSGPGRLLRSTNGNTWQVITLNGFGDFANSSIHALEMFDGALYAGTRNNLGLQIWRSFDGVNFEAVVGPGSAVPGGFGHERTNATMDLHEFDGRMFVGVINALGGFGVYATPNGTDYTKIGADGFGVPGNDYSWRFATYENALWMGTLNRLSFLQGVLGAGVWRSNDAVAWEQMVGSSTATHMGWGFDDTDNIGTRTLEVFQGKLYLGTAHDSRPYVQKPGLEVWEWPGESCP